MRILLLLPLFCSVITYGQKQHFVEFWDNGLKNSEGYYERGVEHGLWKYWHENGNRMEEANYWFGVLNGAVMRYYENGNIQTEGYFKKGLQDSIMRNYSVDSVLLEEGFFRLDRRMGEWNYWFNSGT